MATRTATERLLLRLEWQVLRRLDGRIAGGYRTTHRGGSTDLAGLRDYAAGDDARHIDWNVTARLNEPQLRVFNEDRELTVWLVLDRSASMTVGPPGRGKHEVLSELALVVARLFTSLALAEEERTRQRQPLFRRVRDHPDDGAARIEFARFLIRQGQLDAARNQLERAAEPGPTAPPARELLAQVERWLRVQSG